MVPTLLHRPQPFPDESLSGYLLRVAELNGFATAKWISELASLRRKFAIVRQDMRPMAELLGIDVAELERRCYWPTNWAGDRQMHLFFGLPIPVRALNLLRPRICPDCLKASPHIRQSWDLALTAVCPEHRCVLLDACPECGSALSWNRSAVCQCHHCGYDLRDAAIPVPRFRILDRIEGVRPLMACVVLGQIVAHPRAARMAIVDIPGGVPR